MSVPKVRAEVTRDFGDAELRVKVSNCFYRLKVVHDSSTFYIRCLKNLEPEEVWKVVEEVAAAYGVKAAEPKVEEGSVDG